MDETKPKENIYSRDRIETASVQAPAESTKAPEPSQTATGTPPPPEPDIRVKIATLATNAASNWPASLAEIPQFLKKTKRTWLTLAAGVAALIVLSMLTQRAADWLKDRRERRQEQAVATVTPDRLIARCGQAAQDETKEVYPIVMRTMSYQRRGEKLVMAFSRTDEEKSDWVFLSMQDANGASVYDTPQAKIAALPCLDSRK
jgi:hypothetical protein